MLWMIWCGVLADLGCMYEIDSCCLSFVGSMLMLWMIGVNVVDDNLLVRFLGLLGLIPTSGIKSLVGRFKEARLKLFEGYPGNDQEDIEGSTQQCTKSGVTKHMSVAVIHQQNGLVKETNMTLLAKLTRSPSSAIGFKTPIDMLGFFGWLASINQGMLEPVKVKCIFLGYRKVGTQENFHWFSVQVLQGVEVEEQHLAWELFSDREDSNEAAFAVAVVDKIYAHELLTFNNTVACEAEIWATKGLLDKVKGNVLGMEIVKDHSGNTLRVSQSMFYNEKLVHTLLEGHSILSLEGSLSEDCEVKKNDVGMLDKFDRGLQTNIQVFVDFDYTMGRSITVMGRSITSCKGGYWDKGTRNRVMIRAKDSSGYYYKCLVKGYPWGSLCDGDSRHIGFKVAMPSAFEISSVRNVQPIAKSSDSEPQVEVETEGTTNVMESAS
ncbi:hypothetical protein Tco_0611006 [Tanacetum coccineum]